MIYDDSHLSGSPSAAEILETDTDHPKHFVIEVRKMTRRSNSPRPRYVWLDTDGATELRDELITFVGTQPGRLILDLESRDDELRTIEGIQILLSGHTATERRRILAYVRNREMHP